MQSTGSGFTASNPLSHAAVMACANHLFQTGDEETTRAFVERDDAVNQDSYVEGEFACSRAFSSGLVRTASGGVRRTITPSILKQTSAVRRQVTWGNEELAHKNEVVLFQGGQKLQSNKVPLAAITTAYHAIREHARRSEAAPGGGVGRESIVNVGGAKSKWATVREMSKNIHDKHCNELNAYTKDKHLATHGRGGHRCVGVSDGNLAFHRASTDMNGVIENKTVRPAKMTVKFDTITERSDEQDTEEDRV
jgi:hypothetical protein